MPEAAEFEVAGDGREYPLDSDRPELCGNPRSRRRREREGARGSADLSRSLRPVRARSGARSPCPRRVVESRAREHEIRQAWKEHFDG